MRATNMTRGVTAILFGVGLNASSAAAQPATCTTYPSGQPWQTIVVRTIDGDCKIDPYESSTAIPTLRTQLQGGAFWDVCNECGADVDVRISGATPYTLPELFERFSPPIDASDASTATSIPTGQSTVFTGYVTGDGGVAGSFNKYAIAVKLSTEGPGGWDEFDPELQIDNNFAPPNFVAWIVAALLGGVVGFGVGRAFKSRKAAS